MKPSPFRLTKIPVLSILLEMATDTFETFLGKIRSWIPRLVVISLSTFVLWIALILITKFFFPPVVIGVVTSTQSEYSGEIGDLAVGATIKATELNQDCNLLNQILHACGVKGRRVEIIDVKTMNDTANLMAVIGDFSDYDPNLAAQQQIQTYKDLQIPVLINTSTIHPVSKGQWDYQVAPDQKTLGKFLANYARRALNVTRAAIIFDSQDPDSLAMMQGFLPPFKSIALPPNSENPSLGKIITISDGKTDHTALDVQEIQANEEIARLLITKSNDIEVLLMATNRQKAKGLIMELRRKGFKNPILGGINLAGREFADLFNNVDEESLQRGYFTDGIYATSPIIFDGANENAKEFEKAYQNNRGEEPGWAAASGYDAVATIASTLNNHLNTYQDALSRGTHEDRQTLQDALSKRKNIQSAINGITGPIYFEDNKASTPIMIGQFNKREFVSAPIQYYPIPDSRLVPNFSSEKDSGHILTLSGNYVYKTNIVYSGINFNEISNIDEGESTYYADFFLWFRYQYRPQDGNDPFDDPTTPEIAFAPETIQFINATASTPEIELLQDRDLGNGLKYKLLRIKGAFSNAFDFRDYPFDTQTLAIRFRHNTLQRSNLVFVTDSISENTQTFNPSRVLKTASDWQSASAPAYFQNSTVVESALGSPELFDFQPKIEYSTYNGEIIIKRNLFSFMLRNLLPVLFSIALAYLSFFLPRIEFGTREGVLSGTILSIVFLHNGVSSFLGGIGYTTTLDSIFYCFYLIILVSLLVTLAEWYKHLQSEDLQAQINELQKNDTTPETQKKIDANQLKITRNQAIGLSLYQLGRSGYVVTLALMIFGYGYTYLDYFNPSSGIAIQMGSALSGAATGPQDTASQTRDTIVLRLGSWRIADESKINDIVEKFEKDHPGYDVQFSPIIASEYDKVMRLQLEKNIAPDLLYLSPAGGRVLDPELFYREGYLANLSTLLPEALAAFDADDLKTWQTSRGEVYGLPIYAVSHGIYYNKAIFAEYGIKPEDIKTWQDLMNTSQRIVDGSAGQIAPFANALYPGDRQRVSDSIFLTLAPNYLGGLPGREDYQNGLQCFNSRQVTRIFNDIQKMQPYMPRGYETFTYERSLSLLFESKAAMWMGGSFEIATFEQEFKKRNIEWGIFAVPPPSGATQAYITFHIDTAIALNDSILKDTSPAGLAKREAALTFIRWLSNAEFGERVGQFLPGFYPLHTSLQNSTDIIKNPYAQEFLALNKGRGRDVRWPLPINGQPDGRSLVLEGIFNVLKLNTPWTAQQASNHLQSGLAQWYSPAQQKDCFSTPTPMPSPTAAPTATPTP